MKVTMFHEDAGSRFHGFNVRLEDEGQGAGGALRLLGWVLGNPAKVVSLSIGDEDGTALAEIPVNTARPDIELAYPKVAYAASCGFNATIPLKAWLPGSKLDITAVFDDGSRVLIAKVGDDDASTSQDNIATQETAVVDAAIMEGGTDQGPGHGEHAITSTSPGKNTFWCGLQRQMQEVSKKIELLVKRL